jgi:hypothetical protein
MTESLERAFVIAACLPEAAQESLAAAILAEIDAMDRVDAALGQSPEALGRAADEALADHRGGKARPLDTKER